MAKRGRAVAGERQRSTDPSAEDAGGKGADAGSRSSERRPDPEDRAPVEDTMGRSNEPPRGPIPEGAQPEDYLGGEKPHEKRRGGPTSGASGGRNDVL
jgi:hypothetical protein